MTLSRRFVLILLATASAATCAGAAPVSHKGTHNYYILGNPGVDACVGPCAWKPGLSGIDAYNIDNKIDDGIPTTGKVVSVNATDPRASEADNGGDPFSGDGSCYDNATTVPRYSTSSDYGDIIACNLSVRTSF